ncbi:tRNA (N6-threonylcarbamoyladenosine(37)-N6)-methyltransferase TrmO [Pseudonocardia sp. GCM10023141]|uniref:tRNA (N6-threonylcarbamoyladenosine(37)-N6)-methyltransferase TrmO n=1 Tax=Pseudonocardia sp. GCM10023141 TaxID=3252653 RepID=UPI003622699F
MTPDELPDLDAGEHDRLRSVPASFRPIGYVRSRYREPAQTPIQSTRNTAAAGRVEVFPTHATALDGLDGFDFAWLLVWLDRADPPPPDGRVEPFMLVGTGRRVGTFATRHPARANPIGLSVVRIVAVDAAGLDFQGVDTCHGTPVLDIKPWEQHLDIPGYQDGWAAVSAIRGGWYISTGAATAGQVLPGSPGAAPGSR